MRQELGDIKYYILTIINTKLILLCQKMEQNLAISSYD